MTGPRIIPPNPGTQGPGFPADGSIFRRHLSADASTVNANDLANNSVTGPKIANGAVTTQKLGNKSVTGPKIADKAVGTPQIADKAVGSNQLADNAVGPTQILTNYALVQPQTKPADLTEAPTKEDFNNLMNVLKAAGVLK